MITFQVSRVAQDIYAIIEVASTVLVYRTPKGEIYGGRPYLEAKR